MTIPLEKEYTPCKFGKDWSGLQPCNRQREREDIVYCTTVPIHVLYVQYIVSIPPLAYAATSTPANSPAGLFSASTAGAAGTAAGASAYARETPLTAWRAHRVECSCSSTHKVT